MSNLSIAPDNRSIPGRKNWAIKFNSYRAQNSFVQAVQLTWNDWNQASNPFLKMLPNPEALIFSLGTYIPNRADLPMISIAPVPIKWDDSPIYDTATNAWNNVYTWNCADWKSWHLALETHFGSTSTANGIWESAWMHDDNHCLFISQIFCPKTANCRYDCDFVKYLASKDIEIGNLFSNVTCDLSSVVKNVVETVNNVSQGVNNTTAVVSSAAPWVVGGLIAYGGSKIYKELKS